ncbi:T-lymphoma invasion and metastasis-inducing protein 2 isoform X2 [Gouania willdenowi]|uniref:T-lymphoma invasion and metastasis-inducing protein 2 isoform X2 n=1 Tax=Gouania willdenowi TaxID=441366 RepID=UPI0010556EDE|nr:T-lymphoma invasion and metastasis-inducing protein 2-like isoform X2 [Gouania willdenowi]
MGNSESHYSIQAPKGTSFIFSGKQKPYSLKPRLAKDDALSPHTWWKNAPVSSGYKARCVGRSCLSLPKSKQPYSTRHCDCIPTGSRGSPREHHWHRSPGCGNQRRHVFEKYEDNPYGAELNGNALNGHTTDQDVLEEQSSPRVVIKKDGSLRVEFTNTSGNPILLDEATGPVQLLKFSPNLESPSTPSLPGSSGSQQEDHLGGPPPASTSSTARTSKGSSLSSEGSWYDSPWGPSTELCEQDQSCSGSRTLVPSPIHQLDSFVAQCPPMSITDLYRDSTLAASFPTSRDLSSQLLESPPGPRPHRASFASVLDVPLEEECLEARQYSSYTLPCRRPKAHTISENLDHYPDQDLHQGRSGLDFGFQKKDSLKNRIRRFSDWTGSLSRKKRKIQETRSKDLSDAFDSGVDGLTADTSSPSQVSSLLWFPGSSRAQSSGAIHQSTNDALSQNIYENFMRELEMGTGQGGGGGERRDPSTGTEEGESSSESAEGSLEQLDLLFEKEQGVVRRAGWLSFKPLLTLHKDKKLELVTRRKWKQYWVTLKGCTLLFYETYGKGSLEQELLPCYALLAEDSIVQSVPEHPKKENVFCLSNSYGDVYLFQASNQTDLENWVTAIHSASASLLAKRQGKEDTVRLLRSQVRSLLQKIDMDGKMKKMAELQLTVVSDPKNRKAIENQIQQWEQNLERFNMDLFRMRCYLASLQGGELPNPKSLLAIASRSTKSSLGRLGIFSVSSFHALICSRDEATVRRRSLSVTHRQPKKGLLSSLKGLDNLTKRSRDKRPSAPQIFASDAGGHAFAKPTRSTERLDVLASIYSMSPPEGGIRDVISGSTDVLTCVSMLDGLTVQVPVRKDQTAADLLFAACKAVEHSTFACAQVKQLDPDLHCLQLHRRRGQKLEVQYVAPEEFLHDVVSGTDVSDQLEVVPANLFTLHMSRPSNTGDFGFAVTGHMDSLRSSRIIESEVLPDGLAFNEGSSDDEILVRNGRCVSGLEPSMIQLLYAEQTLTLSLRRDSPAVPVVNLDDVTPPSQSNQTARNTHHRAKSSSDACTAVGGGEPVRLENSDALSEQRPVQHSKSVDTVCTLYQSFQEGSGSGTGGLMDDTVDNSVRRRVGLAPTETTTTTFLKPCSRHMSATERLRKVIQELVDTEKSYVKDLTCLFEIYLKPLQNETFLTLDEMESLFGSLPEMLEFQRIFLQTLEERIASSPDFSTLETPLQFKKLLFSLGGSFLYYADHFKLYSGFCANHIKVQKVLERDSPHGSRCQMFGLLVWEANQLCMKVNVPD